MKKEFIKGRYYQSTVTGNIVEFIDWDDRFQSFRGRHIVSPDDYGEIGRVTVGWSPDNFKPILEASEPELTIIL